jgi:hypothetical protein
MGALKAIRHLSQLVCLNKFGQTARVQHLALLRHRQPMIAAVVMLKFWQSA